MDWKRFRSVRAGFSCQLFTLIMAVQLFSFWLPFAGWFSGCSEPPIDIIVRQWRSCAKGIHAVWDFCNGQKHTEPKRLRTSTINAIETYWNILKHIETYWNILKQIETISKTRGIEEELPIRWTWASSWVKDSRPTEHFRSAWLSRFTDPQAPGRKAAKDFDIFRQL